MKSFLASFLYRVAVPFFLVGCGSIPDDPASRISKSTEIKVGHERFFAHTESFEESELATAVANLLRSGENLSSALTEECWRKEQQRRPRVRDLCVLAWARGKERSDFIAGKLAGGESRVLSIAALSRPEILADISVISLLALLTPLRHDPVWLRGHGIEGWLATRGSIGTYEAQLLWSALNLQLESSQSLDPASVAVAYRIAKKLGLSFDETLLTTFCVPAAGPLAQVRCWRFLSALVEPNNLPLDRKARSFLPTERESGWVLFERSFPERAQLLRRYK